MQKTNQIARLGGIPENTCKLQYAKLLRSEVEMGALDRSASRIKSGL
jgi:hypothetical protein